jgi:hypothetical protein
MRMAARNFRKAFIVFSRSVEVWLGGSLDPFAISYGEKTKRYSRSGFSLTLYRLGGWGRAQRAPSSVPTNQSPLRRRRVRRDRHGGAIRNWGCHARIACRRAGGHWWRAGSRRPAKPIAATATSTADGESKKRYEQRHSLHCLCLLTGKRILWLIYGERRPAVRCWQEARAM